MYIIRTKIGILVQRGASRAKKLLFFVKNLRIFAEKITQN